MPETVSQEAARPRPIEYNPQEHNALIEKFIGPIPDNSTYMLTPQQQKDFRHTFFWSRYFTRRFKTAVTINDNDYHRNLIQKVNARTGKSGEPLDIQLPAVVFMSEKPSLFVAAHELQHVIQQTQHHDKPMTQFDAEKEAYLVAMGLYKYTYPQGGFYDFIRVSEEDYADKSDKEINRAFAESPEFQMVVELWKGFEGTLRSQNLTANITALPSQFQKIKQELLKDPTINTPPPPQTKPSLAA